MSRPRIGEICVELGLMTADGVARARDLQAQGGHARFGEAALALGLLDEDGLARALAHQFQLNLVPGNRLGRLNIALELLQRVPIGLIRERLVVPALLDEEQGVLSLLIADPTDIVALRTARVAAGVRRIRLFVAPRTALHRLVARHLPAVGRRPVWESVPNLQAPPTRGLTVLVEPDPTIGAALRKLEGLESSGVEVVGDPDQVAAMIEANGGSRVYYRSAAAPRVEPLLAGWREVRPDLQARVVDRWTERHPSPYAAVRDYLFSALQTALLAADDATHATGARRVIRLARAIAAELGVPEDEREAVEIAALFAVLDGSGAPMDGARLAWPLLSAAPPPWDLTGIQARLARRTGGLELSTNSVPVEILYTARTIVRAGIPDGADPLEALGADASRHDGAVLAALANVLAREGVRQRLATGGGRSATVLLALLDPIERVVIEGRLAEAGFETLVTGDGPGALALARARPPGVALVDQRLVPRDGLAVLSELARDRTTRDVPVLLLLDPDQPRTVTRAFELGAADVVERPLVLDDVVRRLRRSLDRSGVEDVVITGRCADFPLTEMVRTLSLAAATARVLVASEGAEGEVQVREGVVVGVRAVREPAPGERRAASETGEAAMALLQSLEGGGYEVRFGQGAGEPLTLAVPRRARRR